ncbi:MAG: RNA polymerase sigma factor [Lachnospiraceae bacterium]
MICLQNRVEEMVEKQLLENYQKYYRLAYSYVKNEDEALDVVQESAYKAMKGYKGIVDVNTISSWIYRIVINTSLDVLRKKKREDIGIIEDYEVGKEDTYTDFDILHSLKKLEEKDRTVIMLRFFEDLKLKDIAKITGENQNTVKTRLYRALNRLKVDLSEN